MSVRLLKSIVGSIRQSLLRQPLIRPDTTKERKALNILPSAMETPAEIENDDQLVRDKNFTRYKKRLRKRQWEDNNQSRKENGETDEKKLCEPVERIKRKKMAMLLGYCGIDYYGMQRNPGVRTIEEDLLKALLEAKYITEEDFNNQQNAQFQRSSRTDKGVSAARQVVSLKLPLEVDIEEINKRLPDSIKVFGVKRVTNKFNSKIKCNARTYSYTLPTFVFEPSAVTVEERKLYRITGDTLKKVNDVLDVYKGTKSYHNFTEKKHYLDPSSSRYMMGFTLDRTFIESEWEFAELLVKGQSFMLHQIRKMIGLMIAIVRGHTDMATLEKAFGKEKVMIPTAPGLGLVLDKVHYERYDARYKDSHDSLTWEAEEELVQTFKKEKINPNIVQGEIEGNSMGLWLEKLKIHRYEPSEDVASENGTENDQKGSDDGDDSPINDDVKEVSNEDDDGPTNDDLKEDNNEHDSPVKAEMKEVNDEHESPVKVDAKEIKIGDETIKNKSDL